QCLGRIGLGIGKRSLQVTGKVGHLEIIREGHALGTQCLELFAPLGNQLVFIDGRQGIGGFAHGASVVAGAHAPAGNVSWWSGCRGDQLPPPSAFLAAFLVAFQPSFAPWPTAIPAFLAPWPMPVPASLAPWPIFLATRLVA